MLFVTISSTIRTEFCIRRSRPMSPVPVIMIVGENAAHFSVAIHARWPIHKIANVTRGRSLFVRS